MQLNIKIVASSDEQPSYVVSEILGSLVDYAIDLETHTPGFPEEAFVLRVDSDGDLVICEMDDSGRPIEASTWAVPQQDIKEIRLPLGDSA